MFDYYVKRRTLANANWKYFFTSWAESENPIIDFESSLCAIYPKGYEFSERELGVWQTILKVVSATNITSWSYEESQVGKYIYYYFFLYSNIKMQYFMLVSILDKITKWKSR